MTYEIYYRRDAAKELKKIPSKYILSIKNAIEELRNNPYPKGYKKMQGEWLGNYRIRIGDYRVIYQINTKELFISIERIGHRSYIYR